MNTASYGAVMCADQTALPKLLAEKIGAEVACTQGAQGVAEGGMADMEQASLFYR